MPEPRFPGFDVLGQARHWDQVTAGVVLARIGPPPPIRFFTPAQEAIARPLLDLLLDLNGESRVPVLEMIDSRLAENSTDGWRYADLPEDGEAWQQSLVSLDADAHREHDTAFAHCDRTAQSSLVGAVQEFGARRWHDLPAVHVWSLWTRYACTAFYSHPLAWNEIGFGGPAYPRGYKNLGIGRREPWEVADQHVVDPVREGL